MHSEGRLAGLRRFAGCNQKADQFVYVFIQTFKLFVAQITGPMQKPKPVGGLVGLLQGDRHFAQKIGL